MTSAQIEMPPRSCGDCGAKPGDLHIPGCDVERCPRCGGQMISCNCVYEINGLAVSMLEETHPDVYVQGPTDEMWEKWDVEWAHRRMPWAGEWPGVEECREYGFWCVGPPWEEVPAGTPGASEDLNRLVTTCRWDQERQRWVLRGG